MHIRGDHAMLSVVGRLDVRSAADARRVLQSAVDAGHGDLVLDLSGLESWDTAGLGVIMGAHRRAGRCNRRLVLRGVPPRLQRLLIATRLHRILAIEGGLAVQEGERHTGGGSAPGHAGAGTDAAGGPEAQTPPRAVGAAGAAGSVR